MENLEHEFDGLTEDEKRELLAKLESAISTTKGQYLQAKKQSALRERYEADLAKVDSHGGISHQAKIRLLATLKAKYRAQGLEVW